MPAGYTLFGGTNADGVYAPVGGLLALAKPQTLTVWTSRVGGTRITDLLDANEQPVTAVVMTKAGHCPPFWVADPSGTLVGVWIDDGDDERAYMATQGKRGPTGPKGSKGDKGDKGDAGLSATGAAEDDAAVAGFVGTSGTQTNIKVRDVLKDAAPVPAGPLADVTSTLAAGEVVPLEVFDGYLWGYKNSREIHRSGNGTAWVHIATVPAATTGNAALVALLKCSDGEVLAAYAKEIYRSTGWASGSPTWAKVLDINGGPESYLLRWGIDGDGTRIIVTEYGAPAPTGWADSRYVWFSNNGGQTFTVVYDSEVAHPGEAANSHQHGVCVDPWAGGRLWFVQGHGASRGVYYSDNDGASWTGIPATDTHLPTATLDWPPTTLTATPAGIICGSDSSANGVYVIRRTTNPASMKMEWIYDLNTEGGGLSYFCDRGFYDPETGLTWMGWSARSAGLPPLAIATDGVSAQIVYTGATGGSLGDRVRSILPYKGRAYMWLVLSAGNRVGRGNIVRGVQPPPLDVGRTRGGVQTDEARTGVATGPGSKAGFRASAHGGGAEATGSSSVATGYQAQATGATSVATGQGAVASNTGAVALGRTATASGQSTVATGSQSTATATGAVALGKSSSATHTDSIALGQNAATTANAQVNVGSRHFELTPPSATVQAPAVGAGRVWVQDDGAGNPELVVRFNGEVAQTIRRKGGSATSAALNFPSIAAGASSDLVIPLPVASISDPIALGPPTNIPAGVIPFAFVSSNGNVTVRLTNVTAAAIDPPTGTYKVNLIK